MGPNPQDLGTGTRPLAGNSIAARFSRRQLLQRSALALGGVAGLGLVDPSLVLGSAVAARGCAVAAPRPIPGGFDADFNLVSEDAFIHILPPSVGFEMSTITDFNGVVGGSETQGSARGSDGSTYDFDCDMRFMQGVYVGLDGRNHNASFGFI
jgi:hypothetical protein